MPIQNIPVMLALWGVIAFCVWIMWQDHKDEQHRNGIDRVRRCEIHRRARAIIDRDKQRC